MKYNEMTKNFIFRFYTCRLSIEETAELCFKTVNTVKGWDRGNIIPPECKRLMRMARGRELHRSKEWEQFEMVGDKMKIPTGRIITASELLIAIALLEVGSELEIKTSSYLMKTARSLSKKI